MNEKQLQIRSIDNGYQIIVTQNFKLLWGSSYIFENKEEALNFIENKSELVLKDYERCLWSDIKGIINGEQQE